MSKNVAIDHISAWRGYSVEWHDEETVVLSCANRLYRTTMTPGSPMHLIGEVPVSASERIISAARLGQRFLRSMFYNVLPLGDGSWFVSYAKRIGVLSPSGWSEVALPRPTRVLRGAAAIDPVGDIWFGEYWDNADRGSVNVYRWPRGGRHVDIVHVFERGEIYHVHGIFWDPFRKGLICLTGDRGAECRMLLTRDGFRSFDALGSGSEDWRAVSLVPTPDGWLYGTDAEFQQNAIIRLDASTLRREVLEQVEGPVYYCHSWGTDALFSVTAERCAIMAKPAAVLWRVDGKTAHREISFRKDIGDARIIWQLFMPGSLNFAGGPGHRDICFVSGVGVRGLDAQVLRLSRL